jgi:predicted metal-dependent peptidase
MESIYNDITKVSKTLMFQEPFYGLFLISLNKEINNSINTACVTPDGINVKLCVNSEFWNDLDEKTKLGVLKHELLHIGFFHLLHWNRFPNKKLYNIAADLEINQYIQKDYKGPKWDGLEFDEGDFKPLNLEPKKGTKYYYEKLEEEIKNNPDGEIAQMSDETGHDLWDMLDGLNEAERKLIVSQINHQLKEIAEELENKSKGRGLVPSEMKDYINGLFVIEEPVLDWKAYLRRFNGMAIKIYTKKTRRKPNRRFGSGPALKIKNKKQTLVAIDTSGSVSIDELKEFFNEIYHIYKTGTTVTVVECDAAIQRVYEYKGELEDIQVQGRGGTDFEPVMNYFVEHKEKYNNLIYLTDGECCVPKTIPNKPILWVHSSKSNINNELPGAKIKIN